MFIDLLLCAVGCVVLFGARDNRLRSSWGAFVIIASVVTFVTNYNILESYDANERFFWLLKPNSLVLYYVFSFVYSLFPLNALHPLMFRRTILATLSLPLVVVLTLYGSLSWLEVPITQLSSVESLIANIELPDVQIRLTIYIISILSLIFNYSLLIFLPHKENVRRPHSYIYVYCSYFLLCCLAFSLYTFWPNSVSGIFYGIILALFPLLFSIIFFKVENPFSIPPSPEITHNSNELMSTTKPSFYVEFDKWMEEKLPFTDPEFDEQNIIKYLGIKRYQLMSMVRDEGFTSFREYLACLRVEYFKKIAKEQPGALIKDLYLQTGFQSRSTFYRYFETFEDRTPTQFLEEIAVGENNKG